VAADGTSGGGAEEPTAISRDGRYVAFASVADDLVAGDTNGTSDVFVRDLVAGTTELVSVASGGARADGPSSSPSMSADGRHVAFASGATNLGPTGDDGAWDVFVHDRVTGVTEQVSRPAAGVTRDDRGDSGEAVITGDGRFVAFTSTAGDLVPGGSRGSVEVFVADRVTGVVEQASVSSAGEEGNGYSFGPSISDDGNLVAFTTDAFDLVGLDDDFFTVVAVRDRTAGTTTLVSATGAGTAPAHDSESVVGHVSPDGSEIFFTSDASDIVPGDTNGADDVFVWRVADGTVERLALAGPGAEPDGDSFLAGPTVSVDGRHVAFVSDATNLVEDDTNGSRDVFVLDRVTGAVERLSVTEDGDEVVEPRTFFRTAVSGDGRRIAFPSSRRLVAGDTDDHVDVYVRTRFAMG
jgi:Tol biopolymer transport system component